MAINDIRPSFQKQLQFSGLLEGVADARRPSRRQWKRRGQQVRETWGVAWENLPPDEYQELLDEFDLYGYSRPFPWGHEGGASPRAFKFVPGSFQAEVRDGQTYSITAQLQHWPGALAT